MPQLRSSRTPYRGSGKESMPTRTKSMVRPIPSTGIRTSLVAQAPTRDLSGRRWFPGPWLRVDPAIAQIRLHAGNERSRASRASGLTEDDHDGGDEAAGQGVNGLGHPAKRSASAPRAAEEEALHRGHEADEESRQACQIWGRQGLLQHGRFGHIGVPVSLDMT